MATKTRKLPPRLAGVPNSPKEAKRRGVGWWYTREGSALLLHNAHDPAGRPVGRVAPKFEKDENEFHMAVRMHLNLPDDAAVPLDGTLERVQKSREAPRPTPTDYEPCPIETPPPRTRPAKVNGLLAGGDKPPRPRSAKWRHVRAWCADLIDYYHERGSYLTVSGLIHQASRVEWPEGRRTKLIRRIKAVYAAEYAVERAELEQMARDRPQIAKKGAPGDSVAESASEGGRKCRRRGAPDNHAGGQSDEKRDSWGNRAESKLSRVARCVTAEPQTAESVAWQAGVGDAVKYLDKLREQKHVVRKGGEYKLRKGVGECRVEV